LQLCYRRFSSSFFFTELIQRYPGAFHGYCKCSDESHIRAIRGDITPRSLPKHDRPPSLRRLCFCDAANARAWA
jgi:hypothetical protein